MHRPILPLISLVLAASLSGCAVGTLMQDGPSIGNDAGTSDPSAADSGVEGNSPTPDAGSPGQTTDAGSDSQTNVDAAAPPSYDAAVDAVVHHDAAPAAPDASVQPVDAGVDSGSSVDDAGQGSPTCVAPTDTASCTACQKQTTYPCQPNGCFNGYYCKVSASSAACNSSPGC